jgi:hypothetical protein
MTSARTISRIHTWIWVLIYGGLLILVLGLATARTDATGDTMTARTIQQLFDLTGKTALVTGGSRGLGLQMAHALGEAGARIMLSSRKAADLEEAVADLQAAGIDARWIAADCARGGRHPPPGRRNPGAHGRRGHPGQQRRRRLGRARPKTTRWRPGTRS